MLTLQDSARTTYREAIAGRGSSAPLRTGLEQRLRRIPFEARATPRALSAALRQSLRRLAGVRPRLPKTLQSPVFAFSLSALLVFSLTGLTANPASLLRHPVEAAESGAATVLETGRRTLSIWVSTLHSTIDRSADGALEVRDQVNAGVEAFESLFAGLKQETDHD